MQKLSIALLCAAISTSAMAGTSLTKQYNKATVASAMHNLKQLPLLSISKGQHTITFTTWTNAPMHNGWQNLSDDTWVALTSQDKAKCHLFPAKMRNERIEEALGMPPLKNYKGWNLVTFQVANQQANLEATDSRRHGIFRPCFSTDSIRKTKCTYSINSKTPNYDAFLLDLSNQQFAYTNGYPWTGLGYTYDWGRKAKTIDGLSEFIVTKGTPVKVLNTKSADQFCS